MADSVEPKEETVRIMVPAQAGEPMQTGAPKRETVRIHLPSRPPANLPVPDDLGPAGVLSTAVEPLSVSPKEETARITLLPDPPTKPAVAMKKTQPLIDLPPTDRPTISATVAPQTSATSEYFPVPAPIRTIDAIPMQLCWALLGVSAAILLIQIWSYFS
jgi:hypothetical protein